MWLDLLPVTLSLGMVEKWACMHLWFVDPTSSQAATQLLAHLCTFTPGWYGVKIRTKSRKLVAWDKNSLVSKEEKKKKKAWERKSLTTSQRQTNAQQVLHPLLIKSVLISMYSKIFSIWGNFTIKCVLFFYVLYTWGNRQCLSKSV